MKRPPLHRPAVDVEDRQHRQEGLGVDLFRNLLKPVQFQSRHHAKQHRLVCFTEPADAFEDGNAPAEHAQNRFANLLVDSGGRSGCLGSARRGRPTNCVVVDRDAGLVLRDD